VCAISARLGQTVCPLSGIEYQIGEIEPPSCDPEPFKGFGKLTSAGRFFKRLPVPPPKRRAQEHRRRQDTRLVSSKA